MGGFGSGRPRGSEKIEDHRVLDVSAMNKAGCFSGPRSGSWQWSRNQQVIANICYRHEDDRLHIDYRIRPAGGVWQDVNQIIRIDWHPCRFGGRRPYFACPGIRTGVTCAKRVTKLFGASTWFLCRNCYGLSYASQSEDVFDRAIRKANRLRQRLDRNAQGLGCIPQRPRGMWRKTYDRHIDAILTLDECADQKLWLIAARFLKHGDM